MMKMEKAAELAADDAEAEERNKLIAFLDKVYELAINGNRVQEKTCKQVADEYLTRYGNVALAVKRLVRNQTRICATSGFLTNIGGLVTVPVSLPANLTSVLYVQMRMIAIIAAMGGFSPTDDEVRGFAYRCLLGTSIADSLKGGGVKIANKAGGAFVKKHVAGAALIKINKVVGFRLITKAGTTGVINLTKLVPVLGGFVGGGVDYVSTRLIAKKACKEFIDVQVDIPKEPH